MKYGSLEYRYAAPIAEALFDNEQFRYWVLSRSKFAEFADARLLKDEMRSRRNNPTAEWWRFHFQMKCDCDGCVGGRETDIFAVFEGRGRRRFGMHFEVKQPNDKFDPARLQDHRYPVRAECWVKNPPPKVLPHEDASTGVFFSEDNRSKYAPFLDNFSTKITFQEIEETFPRVATWTK